MKNKDLIVKYRSDNLFELTQDMSFYFAEQSCYLRLLPEFKKFIEKTGAYDDGLYLTIPKEFATDFGSIPQVFQALISPVGNASKAYVVHDYLIALFYLGIISRKTADKVFLLALKKLKVGKIKMYTLYGFVRFYSMCLFPIEKQFVKNTNNLSKI